jgi:hypothetical protein
MTGPLRGAFLEDLTWLEAKVWFDRDPVIVIGIGAIAKEHGHHLPLNTDFRIAASIDTSDVATWRDENDVTILIGKGLNTNPREVKRSLGGRQLLPILNRMFNISHANFCE